MSRPLLRVYNSWDESAKTALIPKGETVLYSSLRWENRWSASGAFEIHLSPTKINMSIFEPFDIVELICGEDTPTEKYGIIISAEFIHNENGSEFIVRGKMLSSVLGFRLVGDLSGSTSSNASTVMGKIVFGAFESDAPDSRKQNRQIFGQSPNVTFVDTNEEYADYEWNENKTALDWLEEISAKTEVGFYCSIDFPEKIFHFYTDVYRANANLINLQIRECREIRAVKSIDNYINAIVEILDMSASTGTEIYLPFTYERRNDECADIRRIEASVIHNLRTEFRDSYFKGYEDCEDINNIEADMSSSPLKYMRDYKVGDVCTVRVPEMGMAAELPIDGVTQVWEDAYTVSVSFGKKQKNVFEKIRKDAKRK